MNQQAARAWYLDARDGQHLRELVRRGYWEEFTEDQLEAELRTLIERLVRTERARAEPD